MKTKKAFVFDFDETLAHTDAVVLDGTEDKFAEFSNPDTILNGTPLDLMDLAKEVYDEGHSVFVLTARNDCVAKAKRKVLLSIIENHQIVYFFDDDETNIELANELDCRARQV